MMSKNPLGGISCILLVIGGLNWGLIGLGMLLGKSWNVVNMLLGSIPMVEAIVYLLVGLAAIYSLVDCLRGGHQH